jgi:hypothetical protein
VAEFLHIFHVYGRRAVGKSNFSRQRCCRGSKSVDQMGAMHGGCYDASFLSGEGGKRIPGKETIVSRGGR